MKHMKSLIALAAVCLLVAPAFSMPCPDGRGNKDGYGDPWADLTDEEMESMTLADLREMREDQKDQRPMNDGQMNKRPMNKGPMDNGQMGEHSGGMCGLFLMDLSAEDLEDMTLAEIKELREEKIAELESMTLAEIEVLREERREEKKAEMENMTLAEIKEMREDRNRPVGKVNCVLLMDLSAEELESMTLAEIGELSEERRAEMENMTLAEIEKFREEKKAEMENMTLAELKEKMELCRMIGCGGGDMKAPQGFQDNQRGMAENCKFNANQPMKQQQGRGDNQFQMNGPAFSR